MAYAGPNGALMGIGLAISGATPHKSATTANKGKSIFITANLRLSKGWPSTKGINPEFLDLNPEPQFRAVTAPS
jgi:hypothetical protein